MQERIYLVLINMFVVAVVCLNLCSALAEFVVINVTNGQIEGSLDTTIPEGNMYYAFKGIRYAEPPKRFEDSVPVKNWEGIYDATEDKPICIQATQSSSKESEDCLYLSVYTPRLPDIRNESIPVMFWIHGGGFFAGDSLYTSYGPDYLLDNNVVVVTINYRLNLLGFLSTGDKRIPGNNGIKDLILGLKWVQKNIRFFGGDPNQVTIFGQSAGAALVSYILLSPLTIGKGYFHRAITQSGSSLSQWSLQRDPATLYKHVVEVTFCNLLQLLGEDAVLKCLKTMPLVAIRSAIAAVVGLQTLLKLNFLNGIDFAPVYENPSPTAAITNLAYDTLANKQIPKIALLTGITSEEGLGFIDINQILRPILIQLDLDARILVPVDMYATAGNIKKFIAPKIKDYYFDKSPVVISSDSKIVRYLSDNEFNKPFRHFLTLVANKTTQYCYVFSYSSALNGQLNYTGLEHVSHGGELSYLFRSAADKNVLITAQDRIVISRITKLWTNFAKYGNPTPATNDSTLSGITWPTAWLNGSNVNCLNMGQEFTIVRNPKEQGYQMWKKLYDTYGHPRDTYK